MNQIQYGRLTKGYQNYLMCVPPSARDPNIDAHPTTPDLNRKIAKRRFQGLVAQWRRRLHLWDHVEVRRDPSSGAFYCERTSES